mmetsp:Transcript_17430/g.29787  ORF Transcript_17430/g.29787 Transcript_17430/m.29787 type:complete len:118 (+) Transcript_17430:2585-2938(+)
MACLIEANIGPSIMFFAEPLLQNYSLAHRLAAMFLNVDHQSKVSRPSIRDKCMHTDRDRYCLLLVLCIGSFTILYGSNGDILLQMLAALPGVPQVSKRHLDLVLVSVGAYFLQVFFV